MSNPVTTTTAQVESKPGGTTTVVAIAELRDIWLTARGPIVILIFSLLLSLLTYLTAANEELNILDQRDTVNLVLQITLGTGIALSLLFCADSVSGERERQTLEVLLLTPVTRRTIVLGKLLATLSLWPVIVIISLPYVAALKPSSDIFVDAILATMVVGSILAVAFSCLALILSIWSDSNRLSIFVSFFAFVALMAPTQLPGGLKGWFGDLFIKVNPVTSGSRFIDRLVVNGRSWDEEASLLIAPIAVLVIGAIALYYFAGRLQLEGGRRE